MEQKRKHFGLRIPEDVYTGLRALAEKNNRSMNKEVLHIIRCAVEQHEAERITTDARKQGFLQVSEAEQQ